MVKTHSADTSPKSGRQRRHCGQERKEHQHKAESHEVWQAVAPGFAHHVGRFGHIGQVSGFTNATAIAVDLQRVLLLLIAAPRIAGTVVHDAIGSTNGIIIGTAAATVGIARCIQSDTQAVHRLRSSISHGHARKFHIGTRDKKAAREEGGHQRGQQAHLDNAATGQVQFFHQVTTQEGASSARRNRDDAHDQSRDYWRNTKLIFDLFGQKCSKPCYDQSLCCTRQVQEEECRILEERQHSAR